MKTLSNKFWYILIAVFAFAVTGCVEGDDLLTETFQTGGLVEIQTNSVNYLVGDREALYTVSVLVPQGDVKTTAVEVWASFNNALGTGEAGLLTTFTVDNMTNSSFVSGSFSYNDLRAATTQADGSPVPEDDLALEIGDGWTLKYRGVSTAGTFENAGETKIVAATRFAGVYNVIDKDYWRILVDRSDLDNLWPAQMEIQSVDATTYLLLEWAGPFDGNQLYFTIDGSDDIDYPETTPGGADQILNDQPITTCSRNAGDLVNVFCGEPTTNTAVRVDPSGEDILYMAFGYFTAGSGPREFYQVLQKEVD